MNSFLARVAISFIFISLVAFGIRIMDGVSRRPVPASSRSVVSSGVPEVISVTAFFPNSIKNGGNLDCKTVFALTRVVEATESKDKEAIKLLLSGLIEEEKKQGFFTNINDGVKLQSLIIDKGVARADFNAVLVDEAGGSCRNQGIKNQIIETLKQFPGIREVIISP